jgi:hypothetical protein
VDLLQIFLINQTKGQSMWMSHSDGKYSLPDSSESSLSNLFGSSTLASSSIALVVDGVA